MNASLPEIELPATRLPEDACPSVIADLLALCKARLCALVVFTAAVGFALAAGRWFDWAAFAWMLIGTTLSAFGANAANQCMEVDRDARMKRTRNRPLPSGRLDRGTAAMVAVAMCVAGPAVLLFSVNWVTAALSAACIIIYIAIYTPLKTRSTANTFVGAVCGAIPPMMGWSAATGTLEPGAFVLGAILFVWQIPHFLALAWMYREDYQRGGYRMLPLFDPAGQLTCQAIVIYSLMLVPVTLLLTLSGVVGVVYAAAALLLGVGLILLGVRLYRERTLASARGVFLASVIYLPVLMGVMLVDRPSPRVFVVPAEATRTPPPSGVTLATVARPLEQP
ncbi:MAG: heme o synthase [Phycisphaerae bacterium]